MPADKKVPLDQNYLSGGKNSKWEIFIVIELVADDKSGVQILIQPVNCLTKL